MILNLPELLKICWPLRKQPCITSVRVPLHLFRNCSYGHCQVEYFFGMQKEKFWKHNWWYYSGIIDMVLRIEAYPNRHFKKHNVLVPINARIAFIISDIIVKNTHDLITWIHRSDTMHEDVDYIKICLCNKLSIWDDPRLPFPTSTECPWSSCNRQFTYKTTTITA